MNAAHWQHFEHKADIGVRGTGKTMAIAFEQAAMAMTAIITDPSTVNPCEAVNIECNEADNELLLVDWLNAVVYEMSTRKMLFSRFEVSINNGQLTATAWGEAIDVKRHQPTVEIKGATYTELSVRQSQDLWTVQCVVDV